jgi:hypothetical protein
VNRADKFTTFMWRLFTNSARLKLVKSKGPDQACKGRVFRVLVFTVVYWKRPALCYETQHNNWVFRNWKFRGAAINTPQSTLCALVCAPLSSAYLNIGTNSRCVSTKFNLSHRIYTHILTLAIFGFPEPLFQIYNTPFRSTAQRNDFKQPAFINSVLE